MIKRRGPNTFFSLQDVTLGGGDCIGMLVHQVGGLTEQKLAGLSRPLHTRCERE